MEPLFTIVTLILHGGDRMLDLFYLAIGVAGFVALWGITKACERA
jgi:hypothetical protein